MHSRVKLSNSEDQGGALLEHAFSGFEIRYGWDFHLDNLYVLGK
jgi:hypothetical protein